MRLLLFQEILEFGKSTLINSIFGCSDALEGTLSEKLKRGKNTTTSIKLYPVKGGYVADTPGFSTFSIEEIVSENLAVFFKEFRQYISNCEFSDCTHIKEGKCGIKEAVEDGKISQDRYERYKVVMKELMEREVRKKW